MSPLLSAFFACTGPSQGTIVGNPGEATAAIAAAGSSLEFTSASATLAFADFQTCGGQSQEIALREDVNLLNPETWDDLPSGTWCGLGLQVDHVYLAGSGPGGSFAITLEPGFVAVYSDDGVVIDGQSIVFELGEPGWLTAELLGLDEPGDEIIVLDSDAPLASLLADTVARRSALFEDTDSDRAISADERSSGPAASGASREVDVEEDTGQAEGFPDDTGADEAVDSDRSGCSRSPVASVWLPLLWLGVRRRQAR